MIELIKYIIGSKLYREQNCFNFIKEVNDIDPQLFYEITRKLHLSALAEDRFSKLENNSFSQICVFFDPYIKYQNFIHEKLFDEIKNLDELLEANQLQAVLLKGSARYGQIMQSTRYIRKMNDIDILLINIYDWEKLSEILKENHYKIQRAETPVENYCHAVALKSIEISPPSFMSAFSPRLLNDNQFLINIDIHSSLFLSDEAREIKINRFIENCKTGQSCFYRLIYEANVVYLSVKVFIDIKLYFQGVSRCLSLMKLVSDIIETIQIMPVNRIPNILKIAKEWEVGYEVSCILVLCKPLMPEINFINQISFPFISLNELLKTLVQNAHNPVS